MTAYGPRVVEVAELLGCPVHALRPDLYHDIDDRR